MPQKSRGRLRSLSLAAFGAVYLALQGILIATAGVRPDHAYGFWMFHESSTVELRLFRTMVSADAASAVRRELVRGGKGGATGSEWEARNAIGALETRSWRERVKQPELGTFGRPIPASYGSGAVLARLRLALDDVSAHMDDVDTCRFELDVHVVRNGRDRGTTTLFGPWRCAGQAPP